MITTATVPGTDHGDPFLVHERPVPVGPSPASGAVSGSRAEPHPDVINHYTCAKPQTWMGETVGLTSVTPELEDPDPFVFLAAHSRFKGVHPDCHTCWLRRRRHVMRPQMRPAQMA